MRCLQHLKPISSFKCRQIYANKFYVLLAQCIYVFCMDLRKTAIIPLYNNDGIFCVMETECVYCAVRAESLRIIQVNLSFSKVRVTAGGRESNPMVQQTGHCAV
jgi:hypothetical protein